MRDHKKLLYASFPGAQFAPCAHSSQIHVHDIACMFIYNYTFLLSIITLTRLGKFQDIRLRITYAVFQKANIKRYSLKIFPPKVSLYFYTINILNCKFENNHCDPNIFYYNLITFILTVNSKYSLSQISSSLIQVASAGCW